MKIKSLTNLKIKLCLELLGNILLYLFIFFVLYFLITLLFENSLSVAVSNTNYDLYAFIVNNRDSILYIYLGVVLIISIYRFISKYVNGINEVYESLDLILKEDDEAIKLPSEVNDFSKKLNDIKYNYILSKKKEEDAILKKNDLIMYMAHDLKTPLTSVIGYLTLLLDERNISKKTEEKYLKIALDKALRVESLTNEFFDITRYNLQEIPINKKEINIAYLLRQLVDECYPMLEENNLKCKLTASDKVMYLGDGEKLARAFDNLLKNSINYSYKNTTIEIILKEENNDINIIFKNKGDKIPKYKLDKLFDKFYRGDESRSTSVGGAGLGLAITKEIIELHKGKIQVRNDDKFIEFLVELKKN